MLAILWQYKTRNTLSIITSRSSLVRQLWTVTVSLIWSHHSNQPSLHSRSDIVVRPWSCEPCFQRLCYMLLLPSPAQICLTFTWSWVRGYISLRLCDVLRGLLQRCAHWGTQSITDKLQRVLTATVRIITGTSKYDRGLSHLLHAELHSIDVPQWLQYKLCTTVHRCVQN